SGHGRRPAALATGRAGPVGRHHGIERRRAHSARASAHLDSPLRAGSRSAPALTSTGDDVFAPNNAWAPRFRRPAMTPARTACQGRSSATRASRSEIATTMPTATVASVVRLRRKLRPVTFHTSRDATTNTTTNPSMTITGSVHGFIGLSLAGSTPGVDEGPHPDRQEREQRSEYVGARLSERDRIGRGGLRGRPRQHQPEDDADRPLDGLTVVELADPREDPRQHQRDDLTPARGGVGHLTLSESRRASRDSRPGRGDESSRPAPNR